MEFKQYLVREIVEESPDVRTFKLIQPDAKLPPYKPGHFFLIRLPDGNGKLTHRPYSVASAPWEDALWFCIKRKGTFPQFIWKLEMGSRVEVDGPYGIFLLRPDDAERVFIGGGVGISALRSMILQSLKEGKVTHLFHSAHTIDGLIYFMEFKALSEKEPNFKFHPSITGETVPLGWNGSTERIVADQLKRALGGLDGKTFYLCGSKEMAGGLAIALAAAGVPKERIKKDEWG
jgi:ferredoxin-NADP reductase